MKSLISTLLVMTFCFSMTGQAQKNLLNQSEWKSLLNEVVSFKQLDSLQADFMLEFGMEQYIFYMTYLRDSLTEDYEMLLETEFTELKDFPILFDVGLNDLSSEGLCKLNPLYVDKIISGVKGKKRELTFGEEAVLKFCINKRLTEIYLMIQEKAIYTAAFEQLKKEAVEKYHETVMLCRVEKKIYDEVKSGYDELKSLCDQVEDEEHSVVKEARIKLAEREIWMRDQLILIKKLEKDKQLLQYEIEVIDKKISEAN